MPADSFTIHSHAPRRNISEATINYILNITFLHKDWIIEQLFGSFSFFITFMTFIICPHIYEKWMWVECEEIQWTLVKHSYKRHWHKKGWRHREEQLLKIFIEVSCQSKKLRLLLGLLSRRYITPKSLSPYDSRAHLPSYHDGLPASTLMVSSFCSLSP